MWPAIIGAIASVVGGLIKNEQSRKEASQNRAFQQTMSDTAYQRQMKDLRAAGINPIMAYAGPGASTPSGSVASYDDVMTPAVHSAVAAYNAGVDASLKKSTEYKQGAETAKIVEDTQNVREQNINLKEERLRIQQDVSTAKAMQRKLETEADTHVTQRALNVSMSQYQQMLTDLVEKQKITESLKQRLMTQDYDIAKAALAKARNEEEIDKTEFGRLMRYIDRLFKPLTPAMPYFMRRAH